MMWGLRSGSTESGNGFNSTRKSKIDCVCYSIAERTPADRGLVAEEGPCVGCVNLDSTTHSTL
jgi:hypothetical protein